MVMFERSGEKIRSISKVLFIINMCIAVIMVIFGCSQLGNRYYGSNTAITMFISAAILLLVAWITSLFLYAFGDLVDSNQSISESNRQIMQLIKNMSDKES